MYLRGKLHSDLKNFIVNVGWTHKIHIVESDRLSFWSKVIKTSQILLSAITASGITSVMFNEGSIGLQIFIAITAFATLTVSGIDKVWNLESAVSKEKIDAHNFLTLRDRALQLLSSIQYNDGDLKEIKSEYEKMMDRKLSISLELSNVPRRTVNKAEQLLKNNRDNDYSNDYRLFIPKDLIELCHKDKIKKG